jgi:hypothetical protein
MSYALIAAALLMVGSILSTDTYRRSAAASRLRRVVVEGGMENDPDVEHMLQCAVQNMLRAAVQLDNYVERLGHEGMEIEVETSVYLRKRADRLLPAKPAWPSGEGLADVIDMATWRRKA